MQWFSARARQFDAQYAQDGVFEQRLRTWRRALMRWGGPTARVLDAGCGSGAVAALAAELCGEVVAVDPSEGMLAVSRGRLAASRLSNWSVLKGGIESLRPEALGSFDVVVCSSVLEYVSDLPGSLTALSGMLSPGGTLLVSLPNGASPVRRLERCAYVLIGRPAYLRYVRNLKTRECYSRSIRDCGMREIAVVPFGWHRTLDGVLTRIPAAARRLATLNLHVCLRDPGGCAASVKAQSVDEPRLAASP